MKQIGSKIIHLETVDSTNNYAANLLREGNLEDGTVILADEQTQGRGQRGNSWETLPGMNLTASFFVECDNLSVEHQFRLSQWVAVALVNFFKNRGLPAQIKWPNDILINDRKVCGVLIENQLSGTSVKSAIVGIGINVNQQQFDSLQASSLRLETGQMIPVMEVMYGVIETMNGCRDWLHKPVDLQQVYLSNLWRLNTPTLCEFGEGESAEATIEGVSTSGQLIARIRGEQMVFGMKEIRFLY